MTESEIKAALSDYLIRNQILNNKSVLINELPFADFLRKGSSRRADLVVVGSHLRAFEIKSDGDNLERLNGQIEAYNNYFNHLTIVTVKKHLDTIVRLTENNVGIIVIDCIDSSYSFHVIRSGKLKLGLGAGNYLSFLDKRSLIKALRQHGKCDKTDSRGKLYSKAKYLSKGKLKAITIDFLQSRYKKTYERFILNKSEQTKVGDLRLLSRSVRML